MLFEQNKFERACMALVVLKAQRRLFDELFSLMMLVRYCKLEEIFIDIKIYG